jgi:hypothetical protein
MEKLQFPCFEVNEWQLSYRHASITNIVLIRLIHIRGYVSEINQSGI